MPISLGQIVFGIGPDTTRLNTSIQDITRFGRAVEAAARAAAQGANTGADALMRQERAAISALQKVQRFQDQVRKSAAPTNLVAGFENLSTRGLDAFVQRMTSGRLSALQFQREMERFQVTMGNAQRIFSNWEKQSRLGMLDSAAERLRQLSSAAVLVAGPLSGIATRISVLTTLTEHFNIAMAATVAGIASGIYVFYKFSTAAIQVAKDLQAIEQTLTAVTGSQTIAQTQMKYLSEFADRAGVKLTDIAKSYGQIQAASKGTNLEGERTNKIFEGIVLAGAKLGLANTEVEASLRAIQQMMSKGVIQAEELKGQLGDRLPGSIKAFADSLGVTTQKLLKMMEAGEVSSSALVGFVETLKKRYGIDESTKIDTIVAAENRLSNARTRLIQQLDKVIGVSDAYKNVLNFLASGIEGTSRKSQELLPILAAVAASFAAGFASTALISGMTAITAGIRGITVAITTLNIATAAGGAVSALGAIARIGIMIAGGTAGYLAMKNALKGTSEATLNALPAVDQYIKAQETMKTSVRATTQEYIKQQEVILESLRTQAMSVGKQAAAADEIHRTYEALGTGNEELKKLSQDLGMQKLLDDGVRVSANIEEVTDRIKKLKEILNKQTAEEEKARKDPIKEMTDRQTLAIKNAQDTVRELNETYGAMFKSPAQREWLLVQNEINRSVENFRDSLTRAQLPVGEVTKLTENYAAALRKVKEGEIALRNNVSYFQAVESVFSKGMDNALDGFINAIVEGKSALESLKDTAKFVVQDMFKTFMTLAALNPIKNALFGTNYQTMGGSGGIGGLLGSGLSGLFSGFGGGGALPGMPGSAFFGPVAPGFAKGGIMGPNGPLPLNKYASGGIAHGPQMALFGEGRGPEAYVPLPDGRSIPVSMSGGSGSTEIHIHEAPGVSASVKSSKGKNGNMRHDVYIKDMIRGVIMDDVSKGGEVSELMERQYGLNRTVGLGS